MAPADTTPRWILAALALGHAGVFGWAATVLPWERWTLFAAMTAGLGLAHAVTGLLALAGSRHRRLAWRWTSVLALVYLFTQTAIAARAGSYVAALYGGLGAGVFAALAALWAVLVLLTLPLAACSLLAVLGGLGVGYLVYGKGLKEGEIDPLRRWLGPVWWAMHRKFYIDELYGYTILPFTRGLATFMYWVDDRWILDPIINGIGRVTVWIARFAADFDRYVVDGTVGGFAWLASRTGSVLRNAQNGQVQVYLMVLVVSVTIWLLLTALPMILTLV